MNCSQCQEQLIDFQEGLLDSSKAQEVEAHLTKCPQCRLELYNLRKLHDDLLRDADQTSGISLEAGVMNQIITHQTEELRRMKMLRKYKLIGVSGMAAAACLALLISILHFMPDNRAMAAEAAGVLARGAEAASNLHTIYIKCMMRTSPHDNFASIDPEYELVPIEIWKEFGEQTRWRIEKSGRVAVMDGITTVMIIRNRLGVKIDHPTNAPFDTGWLHNLAAVNYTISKELSNALAMERELQLSHEVGEDGALKHVVTVEVQSGLEDGSYLKNSFLMTADTKRIFKFDAETERLEGLKVYCHTPEGDILVFEINEIQYNLEFDPTVFALEISEEVRWWQEQEVLPDNEKYEKMTPEEAAKAFFEACGKRDWQEVKKFSNYEYNNHLKEALGGLEIIKIGKAFTAERYPGWFVPYEIKYSDGRVKKYNLALKKSETSNRYFIDGGL